MKTYKWFNLALMAVLAFLVALHATQIAEASTKASTLPPFNPEDIIKQSQMPQTDVDALVQKAERLAKKYTDSFDARPGIWNHIVALASNNFE